MAFSLSGSSSVVLLVSLMFVCPCFCFKSKSFNFSTSEAALNWNTASATWYGSPTGAGPDDNGGGCGYKNVNLPPFSSMTSCGNPALFKSGEGCGSCYKVKCNSHPACSGKPSTLIITDACLGGVCLDKTYHFDMSGTLFGSMAYPGKEDVLRHAGILPVQFARVPCEYPGRNIAFHVEEGSNPNYLAILVEYEDGDGDLRSVDIMESSSSAQSTYSNAWTPMRESWGAIWRLDTSRPLRGPFSIRLTTDTSDRTLVARNVIPANWQPNQVYRSIVNYST
ncbi:expansin-B3-like [Ananas comosus]|uniref:Expansin-B3-like n=1 Tax=Ananas comosus TaxID=4615 RepID=A0A6P5FMW9_ANACO|nr:expansin-B3-like [Ananas comosus]